MKQKIETKNVRPQTQTVCLLILATIAVTGAMYWLAPVLIPFVLAIFFTYCLAPLIELQTRRLKFPRYLALAFTVLSGVAILIFLGAVILNAASQISENAGTYQAQFKGMFERISSSLPLEKWGINQKELSNSLWRVPQIAISGVFSKIVDASMSLLSNSALVIIFMIFILLSRAPDTKKNKKNMRSEIEAKVKRYIITKVLLSLMTSLLVGLTLFALDVNFALVFAVLTFFLNFIPNIGSAIATLLPLPVVMLSPEHSFVAKALAIIIPGAIQFALGNIVEPRIMGETLDLHPITILIALIFFGMIWGIPGMFLATPITAVIKIILTRSKSGSVIAELLAGRLDAIDGSTR